MSTTLVVALKERHEASRFASAAAQLAGWGGEAEIVHVLEGTEGPAFVVADVIVRDAVEQFEARGFVAHGHVHPMTSGSVAQRLAQHARESGAELVVMGSRGLGHLGGLFGRSVSHALLAETDLPVLVVPEQAHLGLHGIHRVLVAVADEGEADSVVEALTRVGSRVEVLVVHVPRLLGVHLGREAGDSFGEIPESSPVVVTETQERLKLAAIQASVRTLPRGGSVAKAIAEAACQWEADLVVIGSRRLRDWEAMVTGSTSHDLLGCSDRPVLITGKVTRPAAVS